MLSIPINWAVCRTNTYLISSSGCAPSHGGLPAVLSNTHPLKFLAALPKAIFRQPVKLINEFRAVRKEELDKAGR